MQQSKFELIIRPRSGWRGLDLPELWRFRELFFVFAKRDILIRYKQTAIGIAWAVIQPFLLMVVFTVIFGNIVKVPVGEIPYPVFVYSGLLFWSYFSASLTSSTNTLIDNENIVKKVYFPRLILPIATCITPLIDFFVAFLVLIGLMLYYHLSISLMGLVIVPFLLLISFLTSAGVGTFLSAINIRFRDIRYALPFFIQSLIFITPVMYPVNIVNPLFRALLHLNPMTGIMENVRAVLVYHQPIDLRSIFTSFGISVVLFVIGIFFFRRNEKDFADIA